MRIGYISDLHVEFGIKDLILPGGDVLLLVGDIVVVNGLIRQGKNHVFHHLMEKEFSKYQKVYAIMGNHEHYGGDVNESFKLLKDATAQYPFFRLLENETVDLVPGWKLFASCMWTDYNGGSYRAMEAAKRGMNDHWMISNGDRSFKPEHAYELNRIAQSELARAVIESPDQWVIMTHHTPSMKSGHERWGGEVNLLNYAFHNTQLDEFIADNANIRFWVHGHTHDQMNYYIQRDCKVLCNPKGYGKENPAFDPNLYFEVN